jgi:hypothetical protein
MIELPMFPLGRVVLPTEILPLHIFEPRYRALMDDLTSGAAADPDRLPEMGVVLIERGHEVGGGDQRTGAGTVVALMQAQKSPDGRWLAVFGGTERLTVHRWLDDDPYPRAEVERHPDPPGPPASEDARSEVERQVRAAVDLAHRLGEAPAPPGFPLSDDPVTSAWELCAAAPLGSLDRQRLLEAQPDRRLGLLVELVAEAAALLAFRLDGS